MRSYFILVILTFLFRLEAQIPIQWQNFKNINISNTTITKGNGIKGQVTSKNILFGSLDESYFNGSISFTSGIVTNENKVIGFTVIESEEIGFETIEYGFSFQNNKVKAFGRDGFFEQAYNGNSTYRIERIDDKIYLYQNNSLLYHEMIDKSEYLLVRAQLRNTFASFSDINVSFEDIRPEIIPSINYETKNIQLTGTDISNYSILWDDGQQTYNSKKFVNSPFPYQLYSIPSKLLKREISIGDSLTWTNLAGVNLSSSGLEKTSGNNWGAAESSIIYNSSESFWLENVVNFQNESKILGIINGTINLQNITNIEAGYYISKDFQLQLINKGSIIKTLEIFQNDIINLTYSNGIIAWKLNGIILEERVTSLVNLKIAVLLKNGTSFSNLTASKTINYATKNWIETKDYGTVDVNFENLVNNDGPYHYRISKTAAPETIEEEYQKLNEKMPTNKLSYFNSGISAKKYTFENLSSGEYNLSVSNKLGEVIIHERLKVEPIMKSICGNTLDNIIEHKFKSLVDNSKTEFNTYYEIIDESDIGILKYNILDKNVTHSIGILDYNSEILSPSSFKYGFEIANGKVKTIVNGVLSDKFFPIRKGSELSIELSIDKVSLKINGLERENIVTLNTEEPEFYKSGLIINEKDKLLRIPQPYYTSANPIRISIENKIGTCKNFSELNLRLMYRSNPCVSYSNINLQLTNFEGAIINPSNVTSNDIYNFIDLSAGNYTLILTYTATTNSGIPTLYTISKIIRVGNAMEWYNFNNAEYIKSGEQLVPSSMAGGSASTYSELPESINNLDPFWISFKLKIANFNQNQNQFIMGFLLDQQLYNVNNSSFIQSYYFLFNDNSTANNNIRLIIGPQGTTTAISNVQIDDNFLLNFKANNQVEFFINENLFGTFTIPSNDFINFLSFFSSSGIMDVKTNFKCRYINKYAKIEKILNASNYQVYQNKVYFFHQEEYSPEAYNTKLAYKVYNKNREIVLNSQIDLSPIIKYGDNRFELDVTSLATGNYVLEVENSKKEKYYLRFSK